MTARRCRGGVILDPPVQLLQVGPGLLPPLLQGPSDWNRQGGTAAPSGTYAPAGIGGASVHEAGSGAPSPNPTTRPRSSAGSPRDPARIPAEGPRDSRPRRSPAPGLNCCICHARLQQDVLQIWQGGCMCREQLRQMPWAMPDDMMSVPPSTMSMSSRLASCCAFNLPGQLRRRCLGEDEARHHFRLCPAVGLERFLREGQRAADIDDADRQRCFGPGNLGGNSASHPGGRGRQHHPSPDHRHATPPPVARGSPRRPTLE